MSEPTSVIAELELTLVSGSAEMRMDIMRRVTELFLTIPKPLTAEQTSLFDDVIQKLIEYLERSALAELGTRIAEAYNAPPQIVRRLASNNAIEVAGPVLARSEHLSDQILVEIAEQKSQLHLAKISERRQLSAVVTDVLIDRGNRIVIGKVAANYGANFSKLGMSMLVMRADGDDELITIIGQRSDIPAGVFRQLLSYATEKTRQHLLAMRPEISDAINKTLNRISARASIAITARDAAVVQRFMQSFSQDAELAQSKLVKFAHGGRITEMVAALSVLSRVSIELVDRLICDENVFGAMVLCKATGLDWPTTQAVLTTGPNASTRAVDDVCDDFKRLSTSSARRLIGYWQIRSAAYSVRH